MNVEPGVPDGTRGEDSVFWDDAEDLLTKDYVGCIKRQEGMDQEAGTTLQNDKGHGVWKHSPNHAQNCYASFGDRGTTATVDAFGNIMQLSRFLGAGVGKSGMLCVDRVDALRVPAWTPVPYQVQDRMDWLNDLTEKVEQAERFGIVFERPLSDIMSNNSGSPDKKWLNWRWPCYEYRNSPDRHPKLPSSRIVIQWMVHNGTVLQKTTVRNLGERPFNAKFQFSGHILIRELDCFDNNHSFNNADSNDEAEAYSSRIGPHGYSWVCVHKFPATGAQQNSSTEAGPPSSNQAGEESLESRSSPPFAAATVVTIFKNGEALKFPGSDPKNPYSWRHNIKPGGKMELVIAFRLIKLDQSQESWKNFVIPACDADVDKFLNEEKLQPTDLFISQLRSDNKDSSDNNQEKSSTRYTSPVGRFDRSPDNHIEFMVRRNLEHILSVCAIPLTEPSLESDGTKPAQGDSSGIRTPSRLGTPEMVALTCGDISGHLVSNSASFFAFSFLVEIAKRLRNLKSTRSEVQNLLERIYSVCRGHLRWIQNTKKMPNGCFAPNYRVTGEFINEPPDPWTWLEPEALTDTPFQLLKATQFSSIMQNDEDREVAHGPVLGVLTEWLTALEKADRRGKFAWPHATKEDMKIFRLDDHLWIFFALKSVLNLGESFLQAYDDQLRNEDQQSNEDQLFNEDRLSHDDRLSDEKKPKVKISRMRASVSFRVGTGEQKFNANDLQMEVLRRFTAENGNVRRRMLALTRSPRETRFLLHARDTAFFYGEEWSFLTDLTYKELWDATLQVQAEHDENDDGTWTTTLRFALAIAMGSLEKRINKKTPRELVKTALDVLFRLTGFNGVVPGESDEAIDEAMQPKIFDDERYRHFYFHAGFEVPFLLLTYAGRVKKVMDPIKVPMPAQQPRLDTRGTEEVLDLLRKISRELSQRNRSSAIKNHRLIMKKSIPFNIQIDSTSIVEIGDEWLFNYPAFFGYESDETTDFPSALKIARDDLKEHSQTKFIQRAIDEVDAEQEANGQGSEASRHGQLHARQQMPATRRQKDSTDTEIDAKILDIPKYKHLGKRRDTRSIPWSLRKQAYSGCGRHLFL